MPVEEQLVLAADEVAEGEIGRVVAGPGDQHLLPVLRLADEVRGGREVDDQLRAGEREIGGGRPRLPDVLADRRPDEDLAVPEQDQLPARGEVALLVEDAVVGEKALAVERLQLAVRAHGARVEEVAVEPRRPDERGQALRLRRNRAQRLLRRADERRSQEQVLGRVAGDGELGQEHDVGALVARLGKSGENALAVAVQVADDRVDLGEGKPHRDDSTGLRLSGENTLTIERRYRGPLAFRQRRLHGGRLLRRSSTGRRR